MSPHDETTSEYRSHADRPVSEHSLRAMSEKELMLCAIAEMRQSTRKSVNQDRINQTVQSQMASIQSQLSEGEKVMALLHLQVKQLAEDMAETDATVKGLALAEQGRMAIAQESQRQPGYVKLALMVAIVGGLGSAIVTAIFHIIKTTPGIAP